MSRKVTLLMLVGGWGQSEVESALRRIHQAAARDLLDILLPNSCLEQAVVATDDAAWAEALRATPVTVEVDQPGEPFHFGRRLAGLIERHQAACVLYVGGASAPLISAACWTHILEQLIAGERCGVTNNLHSADWVGFTPADEALSVVATQSHDNGLAWALAHELGWPVESRPPSAATRLDLDTPSDALIAHRHPAIGPHLRRCLDRLGWEEGRVDGLLAAMAIEGGSLVVAGRASSAAWAALEAATNCWVRVYAEERGMRASGRQAAGAVRSLLADYIDLVGVEAFFDELARMGNGVLLDNRVILAARGLWPGPADRYNSDLLQAQEVSDPFLRRFTHAAAASAVPVLMGGHSVVAGGLMALVEIHQARMVRGS